MKLSAAIRIGSMTTKQIKDRLSDGGNGRCALGAAFDAGGLQNIPTLENAGFGCVDNAAQMFPILTLIVPNPVMIDATNQIGAIIPYLNDKAEWSREDIADWVEGIEQKLETEVVMEVNNKKEEVLI